ncbi:MAG: SPOR domain-containing protein [Wenzhouxiangella sp.]
MDKVLKQRLVGAAILIALAVIFVPMLFDASDSDDRPRDAAIDLPPPPGERREVRRLPLDPTRITEPRQQVLVEEPPAEEPPARNPEPPPAVVNPDTEASVASPLTEPPERRTTAPDPAAESEAAPLVEPDQEPLPSQPEPAEANPAPVVPGPPADAPAVDGEAWQVQVASFSSLETAERIAARLEQLGHPAGLDRLVRGDNELHRVWTGPYTERAAADRARAQIAATVTGVEPLVRDLPGAGGNRASVPTDAGFSVQVGSFADQSNADRQMNQLLEQGFEAFIHADQTGSRPIWRVRVGHFADRDGAGALQRRLRDEAGLEGLVVSHP